MYFQMLIDSTVGRGETAVLQAALHVPYISSTVETMA